MAEEGERGIHQRMPLTKTEATQFASMDEGFTPNWDRAASGQQGMERAAVRKRMGGKKTPRGGGTLKPPRRK